MNRKNGTGNDRADDLSRDREIIGLTEEDSDKAIREKLREWAHQYSRGEINEGTITSISIQNVDETSGPQALAPEISELIVCRRSKLSDDTLKDLEANDSHMSRHFRRSSSHKIVSESANATRPESQDPKIPPVPPIPEKWRAEWVWQQKKQLAERRGEDYPPFIPGEKTKYSTRKYHKEPERAHPDRKSDGATRNEAARRANERRRKAFDSVVLEDQHNTGNVKGKENTRLRDRSKSGDKLFIRQDVRLPRSPGMINLAQEKSSPSPDTMWPRARPRESCIEQDFPDNDKNSNEPEVYDMTDRPFQDGRETTPKP